MRLLDRRMAKGKEDSARLNERKGIAALERPDGVLLWIHAASVGESQSALSLINQIIRDYPSFKILVTTGTVTSADLMAKNLPEGAIHQYYPLDHPDWVDSFLDHWHPDMAIWVESELWPNMLGAVKARNIPSFLVNARLSKRSYGRWKMFKSSIATLLSVFTAILAQTQKDAERFTALGAQNVQVTDNLKYNAKPLPVNEDDLRALKGHMQGRPCWLYASSHKGEEELACRVHQTLKNSIPDLLTIIVPRHPDRGTDVEFTCGTTGLEVIRRTNAKTPPDMETDIYIADTLGELGLFYRLAPVSCIGRSFSDDGGGGHNPIEAAQLHCAVLHGPNIQYQQDIYDEMNADKAALMVHDEAMLSQSIHTLLNDSAALRAQQKRGLNFARNKEGVLERVMSALHPTLNRLGAS